MNMEIYARGTQAKARGVATVEFALVLAFFYIPALLIIFDYGRVFFAAMSVTSAAHALALNGANGYWASTDGTLPKMTDPEALDLALKVEPNLSTTVMADSLNVLAPSIWYKCTASDIYQSGTPPPACTTPLLAVYVKINAVFETVVNYSFIPHRIPLRSDAWIRVK